MPLSAPFRHVLRPANHELAEWIHVTYAGWVQVEAGKMHDNPPPATPAFFRYQWSEGRTLPEFCLIFIREGQGELETRWKKQCISAGSAFLLRPGEWHRHRPLQETGWTNLWITFNGNLARDWMRRNSFHLQHNVAVIENPPLFLAQFERLLSSIHDSPTENSYILSCQLIGLLSNLLEESSGTESHKFHEDELVSRALAFIWGNLLEFVNVADVANHLDCGRRSLERRFKDGTGRSLLEEIQTCRMDRARRLVVDTMIPLKECAARSGFNTCEHMRQVFQRQLGISPEIFRKQGGPTRSMQE